MNAHNDRPTHRVMFVDDEEGVRVSWDRYLREQGFDVSTAEDGERAISRLNREPVDVVVADLKMPKVDGLELLEWLHDEQPDTRFILLTGYGNEEVERRARKLGAYEYLNKPISPETLAAVITAASHLNLLTEASESPGEAEVMPPVAEREGLEATVVDVEEPLARTVPEVEETSRLSGALKIVAGLAAAPILGLAFVVFLPVIAIGALFWVLGEALMKGDEADTVGA